MSWKWAHCTLWSSLGFFLWSLVLLILDQCWTNWKCVVMLPKKFHHIRKAALRVCIGELTQRFSVLFWADKGVVDSIKCLSWPQHSLIKSFNSSVMNFKRVWGDSIFILFALLIGGRFIFVKGGLKIGWTLHFILGTENCLRCIKSCSASKTVTALPVLASESSLSFNLKSSLASTYWRTMV